MADGLTIFFGEPDGSLEISSWDDLEKFLAREEARWAWLRPGQPNLDIGSIAQHVQNAFGEIRSNFASNRAAGHEPGILQGLFNNAYHPSSGFLRLSDGSVGTLVEDVRKAAGDEAAAFALALVTNRANPSQATTLSQLRGAMIVAMPAVSEAVEIAQRLANERSNYKAAQRSSIKRLENALQDTEGKFVEQVKSYRSLIARALKKRQVSWARQQQDWATTANAVVAEIRATDETFRVKMGLQAPVEYWRQKARDHAASERTGRRLLYVFFPSAFVLLGASFGGAAALLINATETIPSTVYVVISGGLLSLAALAFWIGRLLTKLFLSQHHLRQDAEERAVMTTTYLALTQEQAASEAERQIILSALFRPTSDGIVKEEGPAEMTLAGALARLASR